MPNKRIEKTKSAPKLLWVLLVLFAGLSVVAYTVSSNTDNKAVIKINNTQIVAEIADEQDERQIGLSNRENIGEYQGMLFEFDSEDYYGFWMKDMRFSLDMVWLNGDKRVVSVEKVVSPESYPRVYYPARPSQYVLELPEGTADRLGIEAGDRLSW